MSLKLAEILQDRDSLRKLIAELFNREWLFQGQMVISGRKV
jgi:hypothetical protein